MAKTLGWIAVGGLSVGFVSLAIAYVLAGRDLDALLDHSTFLAHSCGDSSGKVDSKQTERRLAWEGGDAVEISVPGSVRYRGGEGSEVIVRGSPDIIAHVEVRHGRITLDCRRFGGFRDIEITLPGRTFHRIGLSGSAKLTMENVNQPDLAFKISGSGTVRAQGSVDHATIQVAGSGDARLADLAMKELTAKISGSGKIEAGAQGRRHDQDLRFRRCAAAEPPRAPAAAMSRAPGTSPRPRPNSAEGKDKR